MSNLNEFSHDEFNNSDDLTPEIDLEALTPEINFEALQAPDIDLDALTPVSSVLDAAVRATVNGEETELDAIVRGTIGEVPAPIEAAAPDVEEEEDPRAAQAAAIIAQADYLQNHTRYLKRADALHLAEEGVNRDVARGRFDERWANRPLATTLSEARALVRARRITQNRELIERTYETACAAMGEASISFDLLIAWHRGERGQ